jgi:L-threonylcarbamoyladenylate synthase
MNILTTHLRNGGVAVIPTDTLYGIVAPALNKQAVEKVYALRKRSPQKPCIILIPDIKSLELFGIKLTSDQKIFLQNHWPNPLSIILPTPLKKFTYLHRDTNALAFRMPKQKALRDFLKKTGPLIAPSANVEGAPPAQTITEAKNYFGNNVLYKAGGRKNAPASTLVALSKEGVVKIIRQGEYYLP